MSRTTDARALERLRWKVTAWYVGTFGAILIGCGVGLFFAISHSLGIKLDRSLMRAADEIVQDVQLARAPSANSPPTPLDLLRIPDRMLYILRADGTPVTPDTASPPIRESAMHAAKSGSAAAQVDIGHEHTLRVHATRFQSPAGKTLIAVAAADTEELEDEYWNLITLFAGALAVSLVAVGGGGYMLARRATKPVEDSMAGMRRFMADAAHELRTPVSFLCARAELALEHPRELDDYRQTVRELGTEANRLASVVNDLFTLARADAGERRVLGESFYLDDILLEAAGDARARATLKAVRLDVRSIDEAPVAGDPKLVRQLLTILIDNAIKYTNAEGSVILRVDRHADTAVAVVEDTGIGISNNELPRIYDRFYRAEAARQATDGAGLGLSIAQWIVDVHGARLSISSEVGR